MQGGGFLIAALPPWIVAVLHDITGSFVIGWLLHLASAIVVAALYWRVDPARYSKAMGITAPMPHGSVAAA
jgi:CP family cyanate transporter-like MFS transporter